MLPSPLGQMVHAHSRYTRPQLGAAASEPGLRKTHSCEGALYVFHVLEPGPH